ncbi:MAG: TIGR00282 family metallophosphoesterase [Clostridiales bacterium]|nr:TIGR00282 family metallophosphoesterase [Clostridiales bacterium]
MLTILFIGDVTGSPGRKILRDKLPVLISRHKPDMVVVNGENAAGGRGITESIAKEMFDLGVDVITLGNHAWDNREVLHFIGESPRVIRPANYPPGTPGNGWVVHEIRPGLSPVAVVNLLGRTYATTPVDCPFRIMDALEPEIMAHAPGRKPPVIIVDFHGDATSEKETMGFYLAGRAAAVLGTHTHVQTADERVLEGGTAYITDVGMTGPRDSVLGVKPEIMIRRFLTQMPVRHEMADGALILSGVLLGVDEESGRAQSITRINEYSPA